MNENHELNDMIKNILYTMEHQAKNVKTIKNRERKMVMQKLRNIK